MDDPAGALDQSVDRVVIGEIGDDDFLAGKRRREIHHVGGPQRAICLDQARPQPAAERAGSAGEEERAISVMSGKAPDHGGLG